MVSQDENLFRGEVAPSVAPLRFFSRCVARTPTGTRRCRRGRQRMPSRTMSPRRWHSRRCMCRARRRSLDSRSRCRCRRMWGCCRWLRDNRSRGTGRNTRAARATGSPQPAEIRGPAQGRAHLVAEHTGLEGLPLVAVLGSGGIDCRVDTCTCRRGRPWLRKQRAAVCIEVRQHDELSPDPERPLLRSLDRPRTDMRTPRSSRDGELPMPQTLAGCRA